jgi:3',5'-cyclic-nucleotide phosphodiesterase
VNLRVVGCHGGLSLHHRLSAFLIDGHVAMDAGSLCSGLTLEEQDRISWVLITHAHLDHIASMASLCEARAQRGGPPLIVAGRAETIGAMRSHYFNNVLWPDFTAIPLPDGGQTLHLRALDMEAPTDVLGLRVVAVGVDHSIPACGFIISDEHASLAYTGDTGATERFWQVLERVKDLKAVIMEVSFPNRLLDLGRLAKHHVPLTLRDDIAKLRRHHDVPVLLFHLKPTYDAEIRDELSAMGLPSVRVLSTNEQLRF